MELKIKKLHPSVKVPTYAHIGDAGFDLYAIESVTIPVGARVLVGTGIAMEISDGYVGLIWDKSGLSNNHGLKTLGGVVDAGYRGEVSVGIINLSASDYNVTAGHKVAQMLIQKVERAEIKEVAELSDTTRGHGGFGSTGK
ncbi:MAG TPA: dUTP diphosphatase [Candidatus Yonathbacteria bacterium]|nr:dUTP diphosphatase [Candidatus Yonathbacteria bacterium]